MEHHICYHHHFSERFPFRSPSRLQKSIVIRHPINHEEKVLIQQNKLSSKLKKAHLFIFLIESFIFSE